MADTGAGVLLSLEKVCLWIKQGNMSEAARWALNSEWRPEGTTPRVSPSGDPDQAAAGSAPA